MTLALSLLAQVLHLLLMAAGAVLLEGWLGWLRARLAGRPAPGLLDFLRTLRRGFAKRAVRTEGQAMLAMAAPIAALAASLGAAALVPSFTSDMGFAPIGDLLVVAGLLALARLAAGLVDGSDVMDWAEPALLLAILAAAVPGAGSAAWVLLSAASVVAVVAMLRRDSGWREGAGADFALLAWARAVRRLVFLSLLVVLALPPGPGARGPEWWPAGLALWAAEIAGLAGLLALGEIALPVLSRPRAKEGLAAAMALGTAAVLAALGSGGAP